jgi:2'-hydroxyisoflavone reductase
MKVLVLGGTRFVGRHIAECLLAAGHSVSIFSRDQSADALPAKVERIRGNRDEGSAGLARLSGRTWDACVDVSGYTPRQVKPSVELLRAAVGRYVFISAVMVYGDPTERPVLETHPRRPPADEDVNEVNGETYGALKVACEDIVQQTCGDRCTLLRPQVIAGPHDPSDRFTYWVGRAMQNGEMLAPGDGSDHLQVIDARDVARFARTVLENDLGGTFNLAGPRKSWVEFIRILGARNIVWVPAEMIKSAGLNFMDLPLYRPERGPLSGLMDVSNDRARTAGLRLTELEATVADTRAWLEGRDATLALTPQLERELIAQAVKAGASAACGL